VIKSAITAYEKSVQRAIFYPVPSFQLAPKASQPTERNIIIREARGGHLVPGRPPEL
jgi:hypothetical protein